MVSMALRKFLTLRKPRSGCLEGRTAPIQPVPMSRRPAPLLASWRSLHRGSIGRLQYRILPCIDRAKLRGDLVAGDGDRLFRARTGAENNLQAVRICAQLALRNIGGEFLRIGAAAIAGDPVSADLDEAQGVPGGIASSVPAALGARVTIRDIQLVEGLAGLPVDKAA